ncbi:MAG: tetratricopeptide repeat protein [Anaerolineales bacterium]|nr:tetratricopeptide repeat protein [Anaerolineales bacterium]
MPEQSPDALPNPPAIADPRNYPHAMNVMPRRPLFHQQRRSNLYRVFALVVLILILAWFTGQVDKGAIERPFLPTPTSTRTVHSFALEGDASFAAGKLEDAITAYQEATRVEPSNPEAWAKLARIQTYSSNLLTTDPERKKRLQEALDSIDQAVALAPDDSSIHAIRAFVLDWNSSANNGDQALLLEAEREAVRALQLDNQNVLALAFYAEILVDMQKWPQAEQVILQAVQRDPSLMDVHRVYAYVLESTGRYNQAIEAYKKAIRINPNLTFLYISVGANYRRLAFESKVKSERDELYETALEYFAQAAKLNKQLEIKDPIPYIAIAKTYSQQGDFFTAALNIKKALEFDPANANTYGQLGIIYKESRNFEGSIPVLKCAVRGCTANESCQARFGSGCSEDQIGVEVQGLALSPSTVVYYYTYGSMLAGLSRPQQNYCPEAIVVLGQVRADFGGDATIASIVDAGEQICLSLTQSLAQTPTPVPTPTLIPTPKP